MRFHERPLNLKFKKIKRPEKVNAIDALCRSEVPDSGIERDEFNANFEEVPQLFTAEERQQWLKQLDNVAVSSDAFVGNPLMRSGIILIYCVVSVLGQHLQARKEWRQVRCRSHG